MGKTFGILMVLPVQGEYSNWPTGYPVAAITSASETLQKVGGQWKAGDIHCVFIEQDANTFLHLQGKLNSLNDNPKIYSQFFNESFVDGLAILGKQKHNPFSLQSPLFAFIDPFGAKGVPFAVIEDLLGRGTVEILINFDSDGIGRIFRAEEAANYQQILNEIFGDGSWKAELSKHRASHELYRGVKWLLVLRHGNIMFLAIPVCALADSSPHNVL